MKNTEATLLERTSQMYRRLLILRSLFDTPPGSDDGELFRSEEAAGALRAAILEILNELTDHARILVSIPFPINDWRPGDGANDERWRLLTAMERREMLSMLSSYEELISWGEAVIERQSNVVGSAGQNIESVAVPSRSKLPIERSSAAEYLRGERVRLARVRQELGFLERRAERRVVVSAEV